MSSTERGRAFKERRADAGLVRRVVWIPKGDSAASFVEVAEFARKAFDKGKGRTIIAAAIDAETGRRVSLKR